LRSRDRRARRAERLAGGRGLPRRLRPATSGGNTTIPGLSDPAGAHIPSSRTSNPNDPCRNVLGSGGDCGAEQGAVEPRRPVTTSGGDPASSGVRCRCVARGVRNVAPLTLTAPSSLNRAPVERSERAAGDAAAAGLRAGGCRQSA
jgi:hypothetical protein